MLPTDASRVVNGKRDLFPDLNFLIILAFEVPR
jgi:hypothetical protein